MSPNTIQNNVVGVGVILGWQENRGSSTTGRVIVDAMAHGWPAELCGKMAVGDTILAVDSKEVADSTALFERVRPLFVGFLFLCWLASRIAVATRGGVS